MKIMHICCGAILNGGDYQEQDLARQNLRDGNTVMIIATTETILPNGKYIFTEKSKGINKDGVPIIRLKPIRLLSDSVARRILVRKGLIKEIIDFKPDIIFHHGISGDLIRISRYIKNNPHIRLFVDNHADYNNSAHFFITKKILHGFIYRKIYEFSAKYITKFFYITQETKLLAEISYGVKDWQLHYLPLGGHIPSDGCRLIKRKKIRELLLLSDKDILLLHSGKMDKKKKTFEIVNAFQNANVNNMKLVIIGAMLPDVKEEVLPFIRENKKIFYLGWKTTDELNEYLYAADLYIQPGGQSITMQRAVCAGCAVALYPYLSHKSLLGDSFFPITSTSEIEDLLIKINKDIKLLEDMRVKSKAVAHKYLSYKEIVKRMYE